MKKVNLWFLFMWQSESNPIRIVKPKPLRDDVSMQRRLLARAAFLQEEALQNLRVLFGESHRPAKKRGLFPHTFWR